MLARRDLQKKKALAEFACGCKPGAESDNLLFPFSLARCSLGEGGSVPLCSPAQRVVKHIPEERLGQQFDREGHS